jgi:hypothetical protein
MIPVENPVEDSENIMSDSEDTKHTFQTSENNIKARN